MIELLRLICVNTYTVCTLVQRVQCLPDSAVPVSVGPRTQLSPLPDLWCRFSPGKSDFHNSSSTSVTLHHNNQQSTSTKIFAENSSEKYTHTKQSESLQQGRGPGPAGRRVVVVVRPQPGATWHYHRSQKWTDKLTTPDKNNTSSKICQIIWTQGRESQQPALWLFSQYRDYDLTLLRSFIGLI